MLIVRNTYKLDLQYHPAEEHLSKIWLRIKLIIKDFYFQKKYCILSMSREIVLCYENLCITAVKLKLLTNRS